MGHIITTADRVISDKCINLSSVIFMPSLFGAGSSSTTLYNATAATSNTEIMKIRYTGLYSMSVNFPGGLALNKLFVSVACGFTTIVWK